MRYPLNGHTHSHTHLIMSIWLSSRKIVFFSVVFILFWSRKIKNTSFSRYFYLFNRHLFRKIHTDSDGDVSINNLAYTNTHQHVYTTHDYYFFFFFFYCFNARQNYMYNWTQIEEGKKKIIHNNNNNLIWIKRAKKMPQKRKRNLVSSNVVLNENSPKIKTRVKEKWNKSLMKHFYSRFEFFAFAYKFFFDIQIF